MTEETMGSVTAENTDNKDVNKANKLPLNVILNPRKAAMFDDREKSGLFLSQFGGTDYAGNAIRHYGTVPRNRDCSRIDLALQHGILFPCDPSGDCKNIKPVDKSKSDVKNIMAENNTRELIAIVSQVIDLNTLTQMRDYEESKPKREQRVQVLQAISDRIKSGNISGMSKVKSNTNMILDKNTGKLIPDIVQLK